MKYTVKIEAVGIGVDGTIAQAMRLLATMLEEPTDKGHTIGGVDGNAKGIIYQLDEEDGS